MKGNEIKKSVDEKFDSYSREAAYRTDRRHATFGVPQLSQSPIQKSSDSLV